MKFRFVLLIILIALAGCNTGPKETPLPAAESGPLISAVQNHKIAGGFTVQQTIDRGIKRLTAKGSKIDEKYWEAFARPEGCAKCYQVNFYVKLDGEYERYEFFYNAGSDSIKGLNQGAIFILKTKPPVKAQKAPVKGDLKEPDQDKKQAAEGKDAKGEPPAPPAPEKDKPKVDKPQ